MPWVRPKKKKTKRQKKKKNQLQWVDDKCKGEDGCNTCSNNIFEKDPIAWRVFYTLFILSSPQRIKVQNEISSKSTDLKHFFLLGEKKKCKEENKLITRHALRLNGDQDFIKCWGGDWCGASSLLLFTKPTCHPQ